MEEVRLSLHDKPKFKSRLREVVTFIARHTTNRKVDGPYAYIKTKAGANSKTLS